MVGITPAAHSTISEVHRERTEEKTSRAAVCWLVSEETEDAEQHLLTLGSICQTAGVLVWETFSWCTLGSLVPSEHHLGSTHTRRACMTLHIWGLGSVEEATSRLLKLI